MSGRRRPANLDVAPTDIASPANPGFKAGVYAVVAWIHQNSQLVSAEAASGASDGALGGTTNPVLLLGGTAGSLVGLKGVDCG